MGRLNDDDIEQLRELETGMWRTSTRRDPAWMDRHLAPSFAEFGRSGRSWTRQEILDTPPGEIDAVIPLPDFSARSISDDVALVTYRSIVAGRVSLRSSIWLRHGSDWLLDFHQGTPQPDRAQPGGAMDPGEARAAMVDRLLAQDVLQDAAIEAALRHVPRHRFADQVSVDAAYANVAIPTKTDPAGVAISSASSPTIVAIMLELADLRPGHRVLEIGAGTGYNAALLARIVGEQGRVVTVELEHDLATAARARLAEHGFDRVEVVTGDGAAGHDREAPYDRIIVTTGAPAIADAWVDQLHDQGRLVVPVVGSDGVGEIHCLVKHETALDELATVPCGFIPMRSTSMDHGDN